MKPYFMLTTAMSALLVLSACTYSTTMVHTEGTASDVIDSTSSNQPNIAPDVTIPIPAPVPAV